MTSKPMIQALDTACVHEAYLYVWFLTHLSLIKTESIVKWCKNESNEIVTI